jgi:hypothetical protein
MPVSFEEILTAFEFVASGGPGLHTAILCRRTGQIYLGSEFSGLDELKDELPDDFEEDENYVAIPDKRELDLGKPLVLDLPARSCRMISTRSGSSSASEAPTKNFAPC